MAANGNIVLTNLDFDTLKASFVNFMRSQDEFKDYDYSSSNMAVLIDLLTYNSHLNAFYTNMELSESFLDSAQLKSSVISHAKELNYVPRSAKSAEALINISFTGPQSTYLLQKGQTFSATVKSNTYTFSIGDNILLASTNNYFSTQLSLFEGVYFYDTYSINSMDPTQRLVISNEFIDTSSLTVVVYENNSIVGTPYRLATTLLGLNSTNKVFFLQQAENEQYEILFGDGVVGYRPKDGSTISINYRVTSGIVGNGARSFQINFNPGPTFDATNIKAETINPSSGGADPESIESIRYFAPRHFQVQERAVNSNDYSIILRTQFPEITDVAVLGGEELSPPQYGHVAIAVSIPGVVGLPDSKIRAYTNFLRERAGLTTRPIFILPRYSYIAVRSVVNYNINVSALTPQNIRTVVVNTIQNYNDDALNIFGGRFRYSRFCALIDSTDDSIVGNETDILVYKKIAPNPGYYQNIDIDFAAPLQPGVVQPNNVANIDFHSVYSSPFFINGVNCRFEDDGKGALYIVVTTNGVDTFVNKVGNVNYDTGLVQLIQFKADSYVGTFIKVYVRPRDKDIVEDKGTILAIEGGEIQVFVQTVRE